MIPPRASTRPASGFTLIELLLAITIFILVIGTIYASLAGATQALLLGKENMERFQLSRAGMNRLITDLRKSLSPASLPFREEEKEGFEGELGFVEEEDDDSELQVTFVGDSNQVQFVLRQELSSDKGPSLDIREVRYRVDDEGKLIKEIFRSLLIARLEELVFRRQQQRLPEGERTRDRFFTDAERGIFENPITQVVCENVKQVQFRYFDGQEWRDSWDSEEVVINEYARDLPEEELTEEDEEKIGLPRLVQVELILVGEVRFDTITDIPAADLNAVGARGNESDFGSALRASRDRLNRLRERAGGGRRRR
ncbi:MAG: prepilin-type N-terminal cleavage/methylation domain-containing protein [Candidatus Omnitrophica bacterium]|nr:hypothetical protein [bacterium]NUN96904.1 prepilin-type N-terminal cleavage/methylation domain-containing protein [Candidatus Omnitrophota bacterium]